MGKSTAEYQKRYRSENADKIRRMRRKYYKTNRIALLEQKRAYHLKNKERLNARHKVYREKNREEILKRRRAFYKKNRSLLRNRRQTYYKANREKLLISVKSYYVKHRDEKLRYANEYRKKNAKLIHAKDKTRYFERYGITKSQFEGLAKRQNYLCALCSKKRRLFVDHDHDFPCRSSAAVRGLLCGGCNVALGNLGDNIAGLRRALAYLRSRRPFQTNKKEPA